MMLRKFKFFDGITENVFVFPAFDAPQRARRIRIQWENEDVEDLAAHHGIDANVELSRILADEISRMVDEDIMNEITRRINEGDRA